MCWDKEPADGLTGAAEADRRMEQWRIQLESPGSNYQNLYWKLQNLNKSFTLCTHSHHFRNESVRDKVQEKVQLHQHQSALESQTPFPTHHLLRHFTQTQSQHCTRWSRARSSTYILDKYTSSDRPTGFDSSLLAPSQTHERF